MTLMRLDEIVRGSGKFTRKQIISLVNEGRVTVDGLPAEGISQKCSPDWHVL